MKLKKVLAAVLAGTMVMASASMVFASEEIGSGGATAWWSDTRENSTDATIEGDGTWEYTITLSSYKYTDDDGNEVEIPPAFCVELTSAVTSGDYTTAYITTTCFGDVWSAEAGTYDESASTGDTDGMSDVVMADGDEWTVMVERSGQDFAIVYYQNGAKVVDIMVKDTNMAESVDCHLICQTGSLTFGVTTTSTAKSEVSVDTAIEGTATEGTATEEASETAAADSEDEAGTDDIDTDSSDSDTDDDSEEDVDVDDEGDSEEVVDSEEEDEDESTAEGSSSAETYFSSSYVSEELTTMESTFSTSNSLESVYTASSLEFTDVSTDEGYYIKLEDESFVAGTTYYVSITYDEAGYTEYVEVICGENGLLELRPDALEVSSDDTMSIIVAAEGTDAASAVSSINYVGGELTEMEVVYSTANSLVSVYMATDVEFTDVSADEGYYIKLEDDAFVAGTTYYVSIAYDEAGYTEYLKVVCEEDGILELRPDALEVWSDDTMTIIVAAESGSESGSGANAGATTGSTVAGKADTCDATPIAAAVVALLGCMVIVASKKRQA